MLVFLIFTLMRARGACTILGAEWRRGVCLSKKMKPAAQSVQPGYDKWPMPAARAPYGLATFQTLFTPSPVLSPGFASFTHAYSGLPLSAHCLPPSSRVMMV